MIEVGRLAVKLAGRDSNRKCVVVDVIDNHYVMIDGDVRRKKCNVCHLEPLNQTIDIKKGASHEEVEKAFKDLNLEVWSHKKKEAKPKPKKESKKEEPKETKKAPAKVEKKEAKPEPKKAEPKKQEK